MEWKEFQAVLNPILSMELLLLLAIIIIISVILIRKRNAKKHNDFTENISEDEVTLRIKILKIWMMKLMRMKN